MITVGLTGGIGSGKSLVAKIFSHLGIPVFNADHEAANILNNDPQVRVDLVAWLGESIITGGMPDRPKIAGIVFRDPLALAKLNGVIHPRVMERFINWCNDKQDSPYIVHEAAILIESGFYKHMDQLILVTAPEEVRIERVMARDHATDDSVRIRMKNQWPDEKKRPLATYIIHNDGKTALIPAVLEIHNKLTG